MKNKNAASGGHSLRQLLENQVAKEITREQLRNPEGIYAALKQLWGFLGADADLPPKSIPVASFGRVRSGLLNSNLSHHTLRRQVQLLKHLLTGVVCHGLDRACIDVLTNIRKPEPPRRLPTLQSSQLRTILESLQFQFETIRLLVWIALSSGAMLVDAIFLQFSHVNWMTGIISYRRVKSGTLVEFAALPPLMDLLTQRRARFGHQAVYVLPELIFTEAELKKPECNKVAWQKMPQSMLTRATAKGSKLVRDFFAACGINGNELTFKSFRVHQISLWASLGISLKTRMLMAGHEHEHLHRRYDMPAEAEIFKARDFTWKYLEAIQNGRTFSLATTVQDLRESLDEMPSIIQEASADLQDALRNLEKSNSAKLASISAEMDRLAQCQNGLSQEWQQLAVALGLRKAA